MSGWEALAQSKRDAIFNSIPKKWLIEGPLPSVEERKDVTGDYIWQFLSKPEIDITETDAVGIVNNVASGRWSATEVTEAFCHRASLAHQLTSCLHETVFDAAIADAKKLDAYYAEHKKTIGPLHGLPISLKDQFHIKHAETTMGYVGWIGKFNPEGTVRTGKEVVPESEMVRELRALGGIIYCKTSVPHTLMSGETVNNIIGYTLNPKNRYLTSGGSSGGEGALIGLRGSPCGFGTDIGGSIRIPAAFNGLYGIRPSTGRLPYEGMANSMDGQNSILSVVGPLATTAAAIRLLVKSLLTQKPWLHDPLVIELPWRDDLERETLDLIKGGPGKLAFGVMKSDGVVTVHPPVARAIDKTVETLKKLGHKIIEWTPPSHDEINQMIFQTWAYDGGKDVHDAFALSGEPLSPQIGMAFGTETKPQMNASQIAAVNIAKRQIQKKYLDYWNGTAELTGTGRPVDGLIAPLAPFSAARREKYIYYGYSVFVNGLDYTSCVVPITLADKTVDKPYEGFQALNDLDQMVSESYDPEIYDGSHVSIQLVGRKLQEEKVLALAEYIGDEVHK